MQLSTIVNISKPDWNISYSDQLLFIGSCFSNNISQKMEEYYFRVTANPFGELYNPVSIYNCLSRLANEKYFTSDDLIEHDGLFHSMLHHGDFSHPTPEDTLYHINKSVHNGHEALHNASVVVITLGSAYVYVYNGDVVGNCHKLPADQFTRRRLSIEEVQTSVFNIIELIHKVNTGTRIIFTVSPIRHIKDGLHENQISKSTLLCALNGILEEKSFNNKTSQICYFPSYEIMMDELRDYRFYANDMVHPSEVAVQFIWERFADTFFSAPTRKEMADLHQLWLDRHHLPLHPDTPQYQAFKKSTEHKLRAFQEKYAWIN